MSGTVVWITGLPSSGKTTLAGRVEARLRAQGCACVVLDGDAVRAALVPSPGHDKPARDAFYATLARLAALVASQGHVVVVPATSHERAHRDLARRVCPQFVEVHVAVPLDECVRRDAKGLYARAIANEIDTLPGRGVPYEEPENADVIARGGADESAAAQICESVLRRWMDGRRGAAESSSQHDA